MSSRACKTKGGVVFLLKLWKTSLLPSERIRSHLESSTTSRQHIWPRGKRNVVRSCAGCLEYAKLLPEACEAAEEKDKGKGHN